MSYYLFIGNKNQINSNPSTNATTTEAESIIGHMAEGPKEIKATQITGEIKLNNYQTTYNPSVPGGTSMQYTLDGHTYGDARITSLLNTKVKVSVFDDQGNSSEMGPLTTVLIQMDNGDIFIRPNAKELHVWDNINKFYSVEITESKTFPDNTAANPTAGFNPDIQDKIVASCFTRGTLIDTEDGQVLIENLHIGDTILTRDHGLQKIRWIGSKKITRATLSLQPHLQPIRIKAGALGNGTPTSDLLVSPQHRVLVRSQIAQEMFGTFEVLVAAKQLVALEGIDIAWDVDEVEYFHILLDQHSIVLSNGAETETFYMGPQALKGIDPEAYEEILELFPELASDAFVPTAARALLSGRNSRLLAARHKQHSCTLIA